MEIGVNTFGISKQLREDFYGTLRAIWKAGATAIEPMVLFAGKEGSVMEKVASYSTARMDIAGGIWTLPAAREKFPLIRAAGFEIRSVHMVGPGWKKPYIEDAVAFAKEQKFSYYVVSFNEASVAGIAKQVAEIRQAARIFKEHGITLLLHNHEGEWTDCEGETVFSFLMDTVPDLFVELDLGWTKFAGVDCVDVMRRYRNRIRILHFKDIREGANERTRDTCFTAVGEGSLPLTEILREARELPLDETGFVLDQDASLGNILQDIYISVKNIRKGEGFAAKEEKSYQGGLKLSLLTFPMIRDRLKQKMTAEELCMLAERAGIDRLDMMEQEVKLYGVQDLKNALERHHMRLECLVSSVSMGKRRDHAVKKGIHQALVLAKQLECPMVMFIPFPQTQVRLPLRPSREEMVENAIYYLRLAVIAGKKYGIKVCVEDTPTCRLPLSSIAECGKLLKAVPGLGLVYDSANMIPGGDDPLEFYEKLKDYICHVHLKDVCRTEKKCLDECWDGTYIRSCLWGEGIVPVKEITRRLEKDGYRGSCAIEYVAPEKLGLFANEHQLRKFLDYLEE